MKLLLVINPISGNQDKDELLQMIKENLAAEDSLEIFKTSGDHDLEHLKRKLANTALDRILIAGGDGTIKLVAEALEEKKITLGILPAGSANGLAHDLGISDEPEIFIPIALGKNTQDIDVLDINNEYSLHISDFGLNAKLIKEYESSSIRGKIGYALKSIPTLWQHEGPYEFEIEANGKIIKREAIMLAFANSKKFGTGAIVNPHGKIDDGIFEILIFKKLDFIEILKTLSETSKLSEDFVEIIPTNKATVTTQKAIDFQIDGEYMKTLKKVNVSILPKKLRIAIGK